KENTKVYDDQSDYFSYENQWISVDQRRELKDLEKTAMNKDYLEIDLKTLAVKNITIIVLYFPKFNINSECIPISSSDSIINYFDTSMCVTIDQPWASWSVNGNISYVPISQFIDYRGPIWIISSDKEPDLSLKDFIYNKIEKYFIKFDKLNKKMKSFPSTVVLGKASILDCAFYSFNDQTKDFNQLSNHPYFLLIDPIICFKNPLPIKPIQGMCIS
ncbi:hypothetical protein MXB_478, partial [Myxobolus squamalis]